MLSTIPRVYTLMLRSEGELCMLIVTFGSNKKDTQSCQDWCEGEEWSRWGVETVDSPNSLQPIAAQPITLCLEKYHYLSQMDLADSSDGKTAIDINMLIGADNYWKFTSGRISPGKSGPWPCTPSLVGYCLLQLPQPHNINYQFISSLCPPYMLALSSVM